MNTLYLVQHANALSKEESPQRPLSPPGEKDIWQVAEKLYQSEQVEIAQIWHSTKLRTKQTAQIIKETLELDVPLIEKDCLSPKDEVEPILKEIKGMQQSVMIVGHLPYLKYLASTLINGNLTSEPVSFQQGGIVCLEQLESNSKESSLKWKMRWIQNPT